MRPLCGRRLSTLRPTQVQGRLLAACLLVIAGVCQAQEESPDDFSFDTSAFEVETPESEPAETEKPSWYSRLEINGYLKHELAFRYREPRSITKLRNTAFVDMLYPYSPRIRFRASAWAYYDLAYDLFDYDTIAARLQRNAAEPLVFIENLAKGKDSPVADVRELYVDVFLDKADIRIGKQFVIWGVLEGVRIVDEINPMDFREMILPDLLDYRIPLWTVKLDYYAQDSTVQFLWIPDIQFHKPAPLGSEWELLQEVPNTTYPESFTLENSEIGVRLSKHLWDTDLTLSYLYTWDDFPVIFRTVKLDQQEDPVFFPTYTRIHMYGATAQRQVGEHILKAEIAYVRDKYFGIDDVDRDGDGYLDNNGEIRRHHLRWALGIDTNLFKTDIAFGITQWHIFEYEPSMLVEQDDTSVNLFIRKDLTEKFATFNLLAIYLINTQEGLIKPKVTFHIQDNFQITAGLDIFTGEKSSFGVAIQPLALGEIAIVEQRGRFVGNFNEHDRVFLDFKYSF